ncbi:MAG: transcriptional regulator [Verrucomicrobiota bacterium]
MIDFNKIDKTIHEKGRLSIMTLLATQHSWSFQDLKNALDMSDGNLLSHLRALHKAGFVSMKRETQDRPHTRYALTESGNTAFKHYLTILETIVEIGKQEP